MLTKDDMMYVASWLAPTSKQTAEMHYLLPSNEGSVLIMLLYASGRTGLHRLASCHVFYSDSV